MSDWRHSSRSRRDGVTIPTIWVAVALSLLLHGAVLWHWLPQMHLLAPNESERGQPSAALAVQLVPQASMPSRSPPASPSAPLLQARPSPLPRARPPRAAARPPPTPPVIARRGPASDSPASPPIAQSPAAPAVDDLASYIEAKRRARAESAPAASARSESVTPALEDDKARTNRIVAANLGLGRASTFGGDPSDGGGIFQIRRIGYSDAEFMFFGWNKDIRHNTNQLVEVRKGDDSDIRIAVVRKMIAIIREHASGDFLWESRRLGRQITLSARPADNAGLEEVLLKEFFDATRQR
jgi:outer membrane biosynthesis protein TonB